MKRAVLVLALGMLTSATVSYATSYLIKPDGSGDFPTIQAALDAAFYNDIIELANGVFTGPGKPGSGLSRQAHPGPLSERESGFLHHRLPGEPLTAASGVLFPQRREQPGPGNRGYDPKWVLDPGRSRACQRQFPQPGQLRVPGESCKCRGWNLRHGFSDPIHRLHVPIELRDQPRWVRWMHCRPG